MAMNFDYKKVALIFNTFDCKQWNFDHMSNNMALSGMIEIFLRLCSITNILEQNGIALMLSFFVAIEKKVFFFDNVLYLKKWFNAMIQGNLFNYWHLTITYQKLTNLILDYSRLLLSWLGFGFFHILCLRCPQGQRMLGFETTSSCHIPSQMPWLKSPKRSRYFITIESFVSTVQNIFSLFLDKDFIEVVTNSFASSLLQKNYRCNS